MLPGMFLTLALAAPLAGATCESLAALPVPGVTVATAATVPAGSFKRPNSNTDTAFSAVPAFCRIAGSIRPTSDSDIRFEVWLPSDGWNGKFLAIGNGGFAGSIGYGPGGGLGGAVTQGYATASTDTGHSQARGAEWAHQHPEKLVDYGHRGIHQMTVVAKAFIQAFYGSAPKYSYFNSCSNGGRQALMEAQRYPADYDGIVAGAPANYFSNLVGEFVWNIQALDGAGYIPAAKYPAIEAAALAVCDSNDGVKDGVIDSPGKCRFDPAKLLCQGAETDSCLTAPQVEALKKIYSGPLNKKGKSMFPGFPVGGESGAGGWGAWISGAKPGGSLQYYFGTEYFKYMVYGDPSWDYKTFNPDRDMAKARKKTGPILNAVNPNLKPFAKRGGKLILYHGWNDAAIPAQNTIDYYSKVTKKVGAKDAGAFVRLYMLPGVQHCGGGPGPNAFNFLKPLQAWVEQGTAPDRVTVTKYKSGTNASSGVERTRPVCPYPQVAKYSGSGSTDDAANFSCAAEK